MQKKSLTILFCVLFVLGLIVGIIIGNQAKKQKQQENQFKIVTSFYPIYVMAANITDGAENIELVNMTETNVGCLHDYTLTTSDMKKIEKANLFIENGLGIESFNDKILNAYPNLTIVDSSKNITNTIQENKEEMNPHIWTSITNYINQVDEITKNLILNNSENESVYAQNGKNYLEKLHQLKTQYEQELTNLKGKKAICLNEALVYLMDEVGFDTLVVETDHEESSLSAEKIKNIIQTMKQQEIKSIFIDKMDNSKNAQMIAEETGASIYELDSSLTGELTLDAYLTAMKENLKRLKSIQ